MADSDVERNKKYQEKLDKTKAVVKKHWKPFTVGVVVTTGVIVTVVVTKRVFFPNQTAMMIKKLVIKDSVVTFATYARRMGPPSYLIECLETGEMWNTQTDTARALGISPSLISTRFADTSGKVAIIDGLHYVRRAMVTPRSV